MSIMNSCKRLCKPCDYTDINVDYLRWSIPSINKGEYEKSQLPRKNKVVTSMGFGFLLHAKWLEGL